MQNQNLLILLFLKKNKVNRKGLRPIYCSLTFKKETKQFATGFFSKNEDNDSLVGIFCNLGCAASAVNAVKTFISNACLGYTKSCKGYCWSYQLHLPFSPPKDECKKKVSQFSLEGNFIAEYTSVAEASRQTGLSKTCISRVCRGERTRSVGYYWKWSHS
jgi:hypothetical protein